MNLLKSIAHPRAEKFIVLDVEGYSTARPYNIGYIIADKYGTIYEERSVALPACIWENIVSMIASRQAEDMTKANVEEILKDGEKKRRHRKYKTMSVEQFKKMFQSDVGRYKVKRLFAYNVSFDKGSLRRLFGENDFQQLGLEYCDIISGILCAKLKNKKYIEFCNQNGFITGKGNVMTKAEIVYKYLTGYLDFVEEHTGLADVKIEYQILLTVFNSHCKVDWRPTQAWQVLKRFCNDNEIKIDIPT